MWHWKISLSSSFSHSWPFLLRPPFRYRWGWPPLRRARLCPCWRHAPSWRRRWHIQDGGSWLSWPSCVIKPVSVWQQYCINDKSDVVHEPGIAPLWATPLNLPLEWPHEVQILSLNFYFYLSIFWGGESAITFLYFSCILLLFFCFGLFVCLYWHSNILIVCSDFYCKYWSWYCNLKLLDPEIKFTMLTRCPIFSLVLVEIVFVQSIA